MIATLIRWSLANRFLVLLATLFMSAWGIWSINNTPVDALPDLSDVQVIIRTSYPGQAPQLVEKQVTYPLATTMLAVPGARTVAPHGCRPVADRFRILQALERARHISIEDGRLSLKDENDEVLATLAAQTDPGD